MNQKLKGKKAHEIWLFTNRNILVWDEDGKQIWRYQRAINCYRINKKLALQATEEAIKFYISRWMEWREEITRNEMQYLLGIRTRAMDAKEATDE